MRALITGIQLTLWKAWWLCSGMLVNFLFMLLGIHRSGWIQFFGIPIVRMSKNSRFEIGKNCKFRSSQASNLIGLNRRCTIYVHQNASLTIGNKCGFSATSIGCFEAISIGNNVRVGANTTITDSDWHARDSRTHGPKPVSIGNDVWIGANVMILKGVSIGNNVIIGAGSVVSTDIPDNCIAVGNPCRVKRQIKPEDEKE